MQRFSLAIFGVLSAAIFPVLAQDSAPQIVFESQTKDFGKVIEGAPLKHIFRFANKGNAALEIVKVEPS